MSYISRTDFGSIVINDKVIVKMIIENLLEMQNVVIMCNRKGKAIKDKPTPFIDSDYYDAVEYTETIKKHTVDIYILVKFGESITEITNKIAEETAAIFDEFNLDKPEKINIHIKGLRMSRNRIVKRELDIEHKYD